MKLTPDQRSEKEKRIASLSVKITRLKSSLPAMEQERTRLAKELGAK